VRRLELFSADPTNELPLCRHADIPAALILSNLTTPVGAAVVILLQPLELLPANFTNSFHFSIASLY
jgi:hypothetical protein